MPTTRKPIHIKAAHEGRLHRDLHLPIGQPIPAAKLEEAIHSSDPAERKRAQFAKNAKHFHHPKKDE
ncbi:MAG TPA: hypothetical protein VF378_02970 [Geothrix sp.]